jgi:apolipoprotein N-acyltransferase
VRVLAAASGEIGLSAGTALLAAALVWSLHLRHAVRDGGGPARALPLLALLAWVLLAAVTAVWGGPDGPERPARPAAGEPDPAAAAALRVAAVQADVALADKWDPARLDSTRIPYAKLTAAAAAAGAELVVWAETAIPAYVRLDPNLMGWLREQARVNSVWIYTGFPDAERSVPDGEILRYNSSGLVSPEGQLVARYAKHHLLPIGERMPFSDALPFLGRIDVGQAEWRSGDPSQPLPLVANGRSFPFAGLICFEAIFPQLARQAVRRGARALVNITNDGWFGHSVGPRQHAELARMRGIECGVPVVRSANNGISFVSDARGRILDRLDLGRRGYVFAEILPGGGSPFVRWGARPLAAGLLLWALAAAVWARRRGAAA